MKNPKQTEHTLGLILNGFPRPSETFIARLIEGLHAKKTWKIYLYILGNYDEDLLKANYPEIHRAIIDKRINVICSTKKSGAKNHRILRLQHYARALPFALSRPIASLQLLARGTNFTTIINSLVLAKSVRAHHPAIMHAQYFDLGISYCLASRVYHRKTSENCIISARGSDITVEGRVKQPDVSLANQAAALTPVSESLKTKLISLGLNEEKITVVHSGLDTRKIEYIFKYGSKTFRTPIKFLQIGRLTEKKGFLLTIKMLSEIKKAGIGFHCRLFGEGPEREALIQEIKKLSLEENIELKGRIDHQDVIKEFQRADFSLCPSMAARDGNMEGIPNVIKESMAAGCIVISSDHSGIKEIVINRETGFCFNEGNVEAYVNSVKEAIRHDNLQPIANNARELVEREFDNEVIINRLSDIYSSLICNNQSSTHAFQTQRQAVQ